MGKYLPICRGKCQGGHRWGNISPSAGENARGATDGEISRHLQGKMLRGPPMGKCLQSARKKERRPPMEKYLAICRGKCQGGHRWGNISPSAIYHGRIFLRLCGSSLSANVYKHGKSKLLNSVRWVVIMQIIELSVTYSQQETKQNKSFVNQILPRPGPQHQNYQNQNLQYFMFISPRKCIADRNSISSKYFSR